MKPEIKEKWINSLRSEEYKQGISFLCNAKGEYCCLGVLTDLYSIENYGKRYRGGSHLKFEGMDELLHPKVMKWAHISDNDLEIDGIPLTEMNDSGYSFKKIADLIEQHL